MPRVNIKVQTERPMRANLLLEPASFAGEYLLGKKRAAKEYARLRERPLEWGYGSAAGFSAK